MAYSEISTWFIFALILMKLLLPALSKSRKWLFLLIPLTIFFVRPVPKDFFLRALLKFTVFYSYFLIGYFTDRRTIDKIRAVPRTYHALLFAACVASMIFIRHTFGVKYSTMRVMMLHAASVSAFSSVPAGLAFSAYMFVVAILFSVSLIGLLPDRELRISHIGKNTLPIYIMQALTVMVGTKILRFDWFTVRETGAVIISVTVSVLIVAFFGSEKTARIMNRVLAPRPFR